MSLVAGDYATGTYMTTEYDAWPLIPEEVSNDIMEGIVEGSAALNFFNRLPNMGSRTQRMPILASLGDADFVGNKTSDSLVTGADQQVDDERFAALSGSPYGSADVGVMPEEGIPGLKQTHQMQWENVFIVAEPIAIILPVPEDVLDDASYDLWGAMRPRIIEAFHAKIDKAIIWGQNRPVTWPTGIVPTAIARGQVVKEGTGVDLAEDISNLMGVLEEQAFDPSGFMAAPGIKASLRNLRDTSNAPIFTPGFGKVPDSIHGVNVNYIKNNTMYTNTSRLITGKMDEAKYAIRKDLSWKLFDQGVITDENGKVVMNLMQQDMKAMRVVMRMGWAVPNPIHALRPGRAGYPFAVLTK